MLLPNTINKLRQDMGKKISNLTKEKQALVSEQQRLQSDKIALLAQLRVVIAEVTDAKRKLIEFYQVQKTVWVMEYYKLFSSSIDDVTKPSDQHQKELINSLELKRDLIKDTVMDLDKKIVNLTKLIVDLKKRITALQSLNNRSHIEDTLIQKVELDKGIINIIVKHTVYDLKTLDVFESLCEYTRVNNKWFRLKEGDHSDKECSISKSYILNKLISTNDSSSQRTGT